MTDSAQVALALLEIAGLLSFAGKNRFQARAYEQGAEIVTSLGAELGSAIEENRLEQIQGIGPSLSRQIQELWQHGDSALLRRLRAEHPRGAAELLLVEGMTPRRIRALSAALDVGSVAELLQACRAGRVRAVKGFGARTEQRLSQAAERYYQREEHGERRMLRAKAHALAEQLSELLMSLGAARHADVAGAVRRGEEIVSEIELVVLGAPLPAYDVLERHPQVVSLDRTSGLGKLASGIPLHIHFASAESFGEVLLRATGPEAHVAAVVSSGHAFPLEPRDPATVTSERDVYSSRGLAYVPPELRAQHLELASAQSIEDARLIAVPHIRGAIHCHTTYSDGRNTIEEMALAAQEAGLAYITITDHSQSATYAQGLNLDRLREQWDEIDRVQERVAIRLLKGIECDILIDGALDFDDAALERFDVVIASIHKRFSLSPDAMTERLVRAMAMPFFKIWGHPLGRILLHRDPIACDVPRVLDALAASQGAVELNADPHRLDLPASWIGAVRERGIPFVISVDAHSTRGLDALQHGITQARRGGVQANEVLNTLSSANFLEHVRPVRSASASMRKA